MAQVYAFTDQNGETRLFAEIHPDPAGTPFNGGTITNELAVSPAATTNGSLTVTSPDHEATGSKVLALSNADLDDLCSIYTDGRVTFLNESSLNTEALIVVDGGPLPSTAFIVAGARNTSIGGVGTGGYLKMRSVNAAPADASLLAGDVALWLDATNGAAKLMVKAKQLDGTVRTGSLALT